MSGTDKRREAARRQLEKRLEQRQLDEEKRRRTTLISSIVATIVVIGLVIVLIVTLGGNDSKKKPTAAGAGGTPASTATSITPTTPAATSSTAAVPSYPCTWTKSGTAARTVSVPSTTTPPKTGTAVVTVKTTQGQMTFSLNRAAAPCTVASFVSLVSQKYYNDTPCHRLVRAGIYVLQCGDPLGTGLGGPGYTIPDEATGSETYPAGTIAMARTSQPESGGSQFFIVYKDSPSLQQNLGTLQYTVFGKVTAGLPVVTKVAAKGTDSGTDGKPKLPVTITSMTAAG